MTENRRNAPRRCSSGKDRKQSRSSEASATVPRIPASAWEALEELEHLSEVASEAIERGDFAEAERRSLELERRLDDCVDQLHRKGLWPQVQKEMHGSLALLRLGIQCIEQNPGSFDEASRRWMLKMIARLEPDEDRSR